MKLAPAMLGALVAAAWIAACRSPESQEGSAKAPSVLDYEKLIHLDSETLAEQGIGRAYAALETHMRSRGVAPEPIEEVVDHSAPAYKLRFRGSEYVVYSPAVAGSEGSNWGLATFAFFSIVNQQLPQTGPRFYAINGGNDLGGMFLTADEVARARATLKRREDWPYIPTQEAPWFGQEH